MKLDRIGITVGGSHHYRVTPLMPDMSWLGEPPSSAAAGLYERRREGLHLAAVAAERAELERRAVDIATSLDGYSAKRRQRLAAELNEIHRQLRAPCACAWCARGATP